MQIQSVKKTGQKTNNVNFKSRSFEIGDAGMIIEILRKKLYSNPIQTLVQEYVSNARDANREAKATRPIKIKLPSEDDLTLSIRDYGPGLSPERVEDVFVKYGNSTKRSTNSQVGGFGIGAKSAWAYTDSFAIITHVDGTAYHYVAHVTKEHAGSLDLISETKTSELNGTEIQIAVKKDDLRDFSDAVKRATGFWDKSEFPVIEEHNFERETPLDLIGQLEIYENSEKVFTIVVDGIPYGLPQEFIDLKSVEKLICLVKKSIGLHFKTGEIEIATSREAITNNELNKNAIEAACAKAVKNITAKLAREIHSQKTLRDALQKHSELRSIYNHPTNYSLKFSKDCFELSPRGGLNSNLFDGTRFLFYSVNSCYHSNGKLKIRDIYLDNIDFTKDAIYWADDETSHANQCRRMKTSMKNDHAVLLIGNIKSSDFQTLVRHLGIQGTSSLGPASVRKTLKKETDSDVVVNHYVKTTSKQTVSKIVNLERNQTTYIYAVKKSESDTSGDYKPINGLLVACGLSFALINKSNVKRVKGNPNFISFKDFLKDWRRWVPKDKQSAFLNTVKESILNRETYYSSHCVNMYQALSKSPLKDPELKTACSILSDFNAKQVLKLEISNSYRSRIYASDKSVATIIKSIPELSEYFRQEKIMQSLKDKYVLLRMVEYSKIEGQSTIPDLTLYLNEAYRKAA